MAQREAAGGAIALQLAAALGRYEADAERLVGTWLDMELYADVTQQVEAMRLYSGALRAVGVQWVRVLIGHSDLIHLLWRSGGQATQRVKVDRFWREHVDAVRALRARCLREAARAELGDLS